MRREAGMVRHCAALVVMLMVIGAYSGNPRHAAAAGQAGSPEASLAGLGAGLAAVRGDQAAGADRGRFLMFIGGTPLGTEDFEFSDGLAHAVVEMKIGGVVSRADATMRLSPSGGVESYTLDAGQGGKVAVSVDGAEANISVVGTPISKAVPAVSPMVIVENNFLSHYQLLIGMYDHARGGAQTFQALVPGAMTTARFSVEKVGDASAGSPIPLVEYRVIVDGALGMSVLVDGLGRVMRVVIPAQRVEAIREDYKAMLDEAQANAAPNAGASMPSSAKFVEQEFVAANGDVKLAGTLTLPAHGTPPYPAVLLISGSGPQDRNGNTPPVLMIDIFRTMAERLAEAGIAVARYDDRGVGASTGSFDAAGLGDFIGDARAVMGFLKRHDGIDPSRLAVLGHSEGGYIAPIMAAEDRSIAACVILAGPCITLDQVMVEQLEYQATFEEIDEASRKVAADLIPVISQLIDDARSGRDESVVPANLGWLRDHMKLNPIGTIASVQAPILIVQGDKDLKVMPYHADMLARAAREVGNAAVTVVHLPNVSHEFLQWPYNNPSFDPMSANRVVDVLFTTVTGWLEGVVK